MKTKSNAPWILGIVGIFLSITHYACASACSVVAGAASGIGSEGFDNAQADATLADGMFVANLAAGIMFLCFILSFFGKSKVSTLTGILLILAGIGSAGLSIAHLSPAGIAAGIVYMCAGISSCCNAKKIKA